jgi:hypothetical protein
MKNWKWNNINYDYLFVGSAANCTTCCETQSCHGPCRGIPCGRDRKEKYLIIWFSGTIYCNYNYKNTCSKNGAYTCNCSCSENCISNCKTTLTTTVTKTVTASKATNVAKTVKQYNKNNSKFFWFLYIR